MMAWAWTATPSWAQPEGKAASGGGAVAYVALEDICRDSKASIGKVAAIGGLRLVDCFPETITFHTNRPCVTTLELKASPGLHEKLKPYEFKEKLKVTFRISRTYIENHHLVGEFIAIAQE
jgi:hypothetical protein